LFFVIVYPIDLATSHGHGWINTRCNQSDNLSLLMGQSHVHTGVLRNSTFLASYCSLVFHHVFLFFFSSFQPETDRITKQITVKPVWSDHPWDPKIVALVDKWSLFRSNLSNKRASKLCGRYRQVVVSSGLTV
jgi:hypothetical protein